MLAHLTSKLATNSSVDRNGVTHFECPLFTLKVNVDSAGGACSHSFFQTAAVDFVADNPGDSLMFWHQQVYRDDGFMQVARY
jgi:hypothetical protein